MSARGTRLPEPAYSIASVSRLTGVDAHTIRAWERRHGAVVPRRTPSGQRRYSEADVARLQLLRAVVGAGEPIGAVARLPEEALAARLARLAPAGSEAAPAGPLRVALLAPGLARQIEIDAAARAGLDVAISAPDPRALLRGLEGERVDAVVLELRLLGSEPETVLGSVLREARPRVVLVVYQFAPEPELRRLERTGAHLVRGPLRASALRAALAELWQRGVAAGSGAGGGLASAAGARATGAAPPPRFDDLQLARLLELPGALACECPSHLASLVSSVGEFERYSRECESRSPADAILHRALADGTGRIRAELEQLLLRVCEHEGLTV